MKRKDSESQNEFSQIANQLRNCDDKVHNTMSSMKVLGNMSRYISNLLGVNPMAEVSAKDIEFIHSVKADLDYPLENHRVFINSVYDLLERTSQKIQDLKNYLSRMESAKDENERQSAEYDCFNISEAIKQDLDKHFLQIKDEFELLKKYSDDILEQVKENFVNKQIGHSGSCEFSFGKPQDVACIDESNLEISNHVRPKRVQMKPNELTKSPKAVNPFTPSTALKQPPLVSKRTGNFDAHGCRSENLLGLSVAQEDSIHEVKVSEVEQNQFEKFNDAYRSPTRTLPPVEISSPYLLRKPRPLKPTTVAESIISNDGNVEALDEEEESPKIKVPNTRSKKNRLVSA